MGTNGNTPSKKAQEHPDGLNKEPTACQEKGNDRDRRLEDAASFSVTHFQVVQPCSLFPLLTSLLHKGDHHLFKFVTFIIYLLIFNFFYYLFLIVLC